MGKMGTEGIGQNLVQSNHPPLAQLYRVAPF
jgi:hypothetical protein